MCYALSGTERAYAVGTRMMNMEGSHHSLRCAAIDGCRAAIYGCRAAIDGCRAAIYGCRAAIYGCRAAIYGCRAAICVDFLRGGGGDLLRIAARRAPSTSTATASAPTTTATGPREEAAWAPRSWRTGTKSSGSYTLCSRVTDSGIFSGAPLHLARPCKALLGPRP
eukprot:1907668-Rhodomonas_salina.1